MRRITVVLCAMGAAILLAAPALGADCLGQPCGNMAFKILAEIDTPDPDIYQKAFPCCNNYSDLVSIFDDISNSCPNGAASVVSFNPDQSSCIWNGPLSCNRPLKCNEAVWVSTSLTGCSSWYVAGASCKTGVFPLITYGITFELADPMIYETSVPPHTTALHLSDLFNEIPQCAQVAIFTPDQTSCVWNGPLSCDADIGPRDLDRGYRISVQAPAPVTWIPTHY